MPGQPHGGAADIAHGESPTTAAACGTEDRFLAARIFYIKTLTARPPTSRPSGPKGKPAVHGRHRRRSLHDELLKRPASEERRDADQPAAKTVAAMASGGIDAYSTWEPHIANGIKALAPR